MIATCKSTALCYYISIGIFLLLIPAVLLPGEAALGWLSQVPLSEGRRREGAWLLREQQVAGLGGQYLEPSTHGDNAVLEMEVGAELLGPFYVQDLLA